MIPSIEADALAVATRTLLAAGYAVSGVHRQPDHAELKCETRTRLGATITFLIAITQKDEFTPTQIEEISYAAKNQNRVPIFVAKNSGPKQVSWQDFLDTFGGAVPSWRALTEDYKTLLMTTACNVLPPGMSGEAWQIFEDAVADGIEFCIGLRVRRFGGHKRGLKVSDMIAPLPDFNVVVIDTKAAKDGFDANWPALRPVVEYVNKQKARQKGYSEVTAAMIVSSSFQQGETDLDTIAKQFLGETHTPLCFLTAETLALMVTRLQTKTDIRNAVRWKVVLCGGALTSKAFNKEVESALSERCEPREI